MGNPYISPISCGYTQLFLEGDGIFNVDGDLWFKQRILGGRVGGGVEARWKKPEMISLEGIVNRGAGY